MLAMPTVSLASRSMSKISCAVRQQSWSPRSSITARRALPSRWPLVRRDSSVASIHCVLLVGTALTIVGLDLFMVVGMSLVSILFLLVRVIAPLLLLIAVV